MTSPPAFPYYAQPTTATGQQVAVIGAGYAGMAAAVTLAAAGFAVTVFEASRTLGGRARRVTIDGRTLDNGQHILVGAYTELQRLMRQVGIDPEKALLRLPLYLKVLPEFSFEKAARPAPWDLMLGLLKAKGIGFMDVLHAARFVTAMRKLKFVLPNDITVDALLAQHRQTPRLVKYLWGPLCVAALNTPTDTASAQVFLNVLRDGLFGADGNANDLLLPRVDLSRMFPDAAAKYLGDRGGLVRTATAVRRVYWAGDGWYVDAIPTPYAAIVLACAPQHALAIVDEIEDIEATRARLAGFSYLPIHTCYLQYGADYRLPAPMIGLTGGMAQWVFDRGQLGGPKGLMAVVISATPKADALPQHELARLAGEELHRHLGAPAKPAWRQVIAERRATFACRPNMYRPGNLTECAGLVLAGDYTASEYPCTLESAVRSGVSAANLIIHPASAPAPLPH
jgi:squalene-associated FAD-dependent desaturase